MSVEDWVAIGWTVGLIVLTVPWWRLVWEQIRRKEWVR